MVIGKTMKHHVSLVVRDEVYDKVFEDGTRLIDKKLKTKCDSIITEQVTNINRNIYYNIFTLGGIMEANNGLTWI